MGNASTYRNWASQILAKQSSSTSSHLGNRKSASSVLSLPHLCLNWDCQLKDWADSILWPIILLTWCSAVGLEPLLEQLVEKVEELTTSRECTSIVQIVITCEVMKLLLFEDYQSALSLSRSFKYSYFLSVSFAQIAQEQGDEVVELSNLLLVVILQRVLETLLQLWERWAHLAQGCCKCGLMWKVKMLVEECED